MRKKGKGLYSSIAIAAAVVLVAVGGAFLFSLSVHRIFKAEITMSLGEIADQSVLTLQREIKGSLQSMRDNAILIGETEKIDIPKLIEVLRAVAQENRFKRMGLIVPDGTAYTTDGQIIDLSDRAYFQNTLRGETAVSDTLIDKVDGGRINVYSAPVVHDREVVGVLFATYETDRFRQNLEVSVFEGQGYSYVVKQNGDTVVLSSNEGSFAGMENLFTAMKGADPTNAASTASLQKSMARGDTGYVEFINRESKYMYYTPLDINDWYLISVVPTSVANEKMNQVMVWSYVLMGLMLLLFLVLLLHIIHVQANSQRELRRIAYVDPLTGGSTLGKFKLDAETILRENENPDKPNSNTSTKCSGTGRVTAPFCFYPPCWSNRCGQASSAPIKARIISSFSSKAASRAICRNVSRRSAHGCGSSRSRAAAVSIWCCPWGPMRWRGRSPTSKR